jgi:hypothetical protein
LAVQSGRKGRDPCAVALLDTKLAAVKEASDKRSKELEMDLEAARECIDALDKQVSLLNDEKSSSDESLAMLDTELEQHRERFDIFDLVHPGSAITFAASYKIMGGDVDISPGTSITRAYYIDGGALASADESALFAASVHEEWAAAMAIRQDATDLAVEMGGGTFTPGTWHSGTITIAAYTPVYLDGQNDPNSVFLFQSDETLVAGTGVKIVLINGAKPENILWVFGTSVAFGAGVGCQGSILAGTAIVFGATNIVHGCVISLTDRQFQSSFSFQLLQPFSFGNRVDRFDQTPEFNKNEVVQLAKKSKFSPAQAQEFDET